MNIIDEDDLAPSIIVGIGVAVFFVVVIAASVIIGLVIHWLMV